MGGVAPLILYGLGTMATVGAKIYEGAVQADAAERKAELDIEQANELLQRERINEDLLIKKEKEMETYGTYLSGSRGTQDTGLGARLKLYENLQQALSNMRRESLFKAKMIRAGAEVSRELASDIQVGTALSAAGGLLKGGYVGYRSLDRSSDNTRDVVGGL